VWFSRHHGEKIPSAIDRYNNEVLRVLSVLEDILKDKEWLVGGKCSYADLSFLPWNGLLGWMSGFDGWQEKYPKVAAWDAKMNELDSVKKMKAAKEALANH
jgi:glutathione S-transferase